MVNFEPGVLADDAHYLLRKRRKRLEVLTVENKYQQFLRLAARWRRARDNDLAEIQTIDLS